MPQRARRGEQPGVWMPVVYGWIAGTVEAWVLLAQAVWKSGGAGADGWFAWSQREITEVTTLSRDQTERARARLFALGLLAYAQPYRNGRKDEVAYIYCVDFDALERAVTECGKVAGGSAGKSQEVVRESRTTLRGKVARPPAGKSHTLAPDSKEVRALRIKKTKNREKNDDEKENGAQNGHAEAVSAGVSVVVASPVVDLVSELTAAGMGRAEAARVCQAFPEAEIRAQLAWLPDRGAAKSPGWYLLHSIEEGWGEPDLARRRRLAAEREARRAGRPESAPGPSAEEIARARLDAAFAALPEAEADAIQSRAARAVWKGEPPSEARTRAGWAAMEGVHPVRRGAVEGKRRALLAERLAEEEG